MTALDGYTGLITSQHQSAARFMATVAAVMGPFADLQAVAADLPRRFDVDSAVGVQLDAVGLWVGISRYVAVSVDQYFAFDTVGVGFDQGVWWRIGDSLTQVTTLDDSHFRRLIRTKISCNIWDGSLPGAHAILLALVAPDGCAVDASEGAMSVDWTITGPISTVTRALIEGGYVPLKPGNVAVSYTFASS